MEAAGQRARERQNAPDRLAISKELDELHEQLQTALNVLKLSQQTMFVDRMDELRLREMELTFDLGLSQWRYTLTLRDARCVCVCVCARVWSDSIVLCVS